jgi:hypothetical protein
MMLRVVVDIRYAPGTASLSLSEKNAGNPVEAVLQVALAPALIVNDESNGQFFLGIKFKI